MAASPVFPRVHAMVLCDEIEPADEEDVFHLTGVRTRITAAAFPYVHPQLYVYVQATGHVGVASCRIVLGPAAGEALFSTPEQEIEFDGPLEVKPFWWSRAVRKLGLAERG